jgi:beta-lactamase superfamily II metal-dependent hydrolase
MRTVRPGLSSFLRRLVAVFALSVSFSWAQGDGNLHIYCINVGDKSGCFYKQGDSTLIVSPNGTRLLIDGGAAGVCGASQVLDTFARVIPAGGLNWIIASHWDDDHTGGLVEIAKANGGQYMPPVVYDVGDYDSNPGASYSSTFSGRRQTPSVGQVIDLGWGASATVVSVNGNILGGGFVDPGDLDNARSIGFVVQYGGFDYLTLGDLEGTNDSTHQDTENPLATALTAAGYLIDVHHTSHHGSRFSTLNKFLQLLQPEFAVISFGRGNIFGHPTQQVMNRLNALKDDGTPYTPAYSPVETIYLTEVSEYGTAANTRVLQPNPDLGGSIHITSSGGGCQYTVSNEGPGTNSFNDGPYPSDSGPPCPPPTPGGPTPTPGLPFGDWPVKLHSNTTRFSKSDSISVTADFQTCLTPFFPYIRLIDPFGRLIYLQRVPPVRTNLLWTGPARFVEGGPWVLNFPLDYYPVLNISFTEAAYGTWKIQGAFLDKDGNIVGSVNEKRVIVE